MKERVVKKRTLGVAYIELIKPRTASFSCKNARAVRIEQKKQRFNNAVHIIGRIGKGRAFREGSVEKASKAEIHKRNTPLLVHEDVCRSDIAVKHPTRNTMGHRLDKRGSDGCDFVHGKDMPFAKKKVQGFPWTPRLDDAVKSRMPRQKRTNANTGTARHDLPIHDSEPVRNSPMVKQGKRGALRPYGLANARQLRSVDLLDDDLHAVSSANARERRAVPPLAEHGFKMILSRIAADDATVEKCRDKARRTRRRKTPTGKIRRAQRKIRRMRVGSSI